jgi:outer membrane protein TolC
MTLSTKISNRKFRISDYGYGFAVILVLISIASKAQVMPLDSVLHLIRTQNPMLLEYDQKKKALDTYADGATSWMAPMVGAGTFMTPYPNQTLMGESEKGSLMFTLEQDIPNPSKQKANRRYLTSRSSVENEIQSGVYNQLRAEAKTYYYKWLVAAEKMKVLRESERIMDLMLKLARIRYPYNQSGLGSIYKAEGRLSEVRNMMEMTRGDIDESSFRLKSLMNLPHETVIMVDTTTSVTFDVDQIVYDTAALARTRSDVRQIEQSIEVMRLNQEYQRYQSRPDFRIRFDHMQPLGDAMPKQFSAMAMISIPIAPWSSKMYKSEVKGMQYDIQAMQRGREAILIEARGMLAGMAAQLQRMKQQLQNYEERIIPALRRNYETVMIAYEENREQLPIVINAWEALNMAQMELLEKNEEYLNMIVSYEKELEK